MAAVVHLMSNNLYGIADLQGLAQLQTQHIAWVAKRIPGNTEMDLAALPNNMGGVGIRDPVPAAATLYISTQSRIIPQLEDQQEDHLRQAWNEDPEFNNNIGEARNYLINQSGVPSRQLPYGPEPRNTTMKSNMLMKAIHNTRTTAIMELLDLQQGRGSSNTRPRDQRHG